MRNTGLAPKVVAVILLLGVASCVAPEEPDVARRSALGEPMNGFPTAAERLGIMAINRARSDPQTVKGANSASYPARPPVLYSYTLSRSARFHAMSLTLSGVTLMHPSPCMLNTNVATANCTGDPACACATPVPTACAACATIAANLTCGTDPFVRIGFFTAGTTTSANGEVAAAGYADPIAVVDGWMDEPAGADGHRTNLTDQGIKSNTMGYGHSQGGCFSTFDVSDSGNMTGATIPKLPTAAVRPPANNAAGSYTFYATWADPTRGAPASLNVVIDGACTAMARELGTDTLNATYKATATLAAGCHNYFVVARDGAGAMLTYPTTGAIAIPVGSATACTTDFLTTAPAASCAGDGGVTPPPPPSRRGSGPARPAAAARPEQAAREGPAAAGGAGGSGNGGGAGGSGNGAGGAHGGGGTTGSGGSGGPVTDAGTGGATTLQARASAAAADATCAAAVRRRSRADHSYRSRCCWARAVVAERVTSPRPLAARCRSGRPSVRPCTGKPRLISSAYTLSTSIATCRATFAAGAAHRSGWRRARR